MLEGFHAQLQEQLSSLEGQGLRRSLRVVESSQGTLIRIAGRELVNFSSNDYLGLASHPALAEAMAESAQRSGTGSTASRRICGTTAEHAALEEELAAAKGTEAALVFSTGVAAATGTIPALVGRGDVVILDKLAHACLIDGVHASGAKMRVFPHNDLAKLESHLKWARETHPKGRVLIVTESVFSMDGDLAPLRELVELKERHGAILLLDEAHAVGVRRVSLRIVQSTKGDALRTRLKENIALLASGLNRSAPPSAIVPRIVGSEEAALKAATRLNDAGFFVPAIRYPTVPRKTARLRITLSAAHTPDQIRDLTRAMRNS